LDIATRVQLQKVSESGRPNMSRPAPERQGRRELVVFRQTRQNKSEAQPDSTVPNPDKAKPIFFKSASEFRRWLDRYHSSETELQVGYYKTKTGKPSLTWQESVDQALCYGWIDGIRRSLGEESYTIRFTPRQSKSTWSAVNIKRVQELITQGLMQPAGLKAFEGRDEKRAQQYSFERNNVILDPALERLFRKNRRAWSWFNEQPPGYRKIGAWYVMSAKREDTRARRLETLIAESAAGRRLGILNTKKT
jgi:uncharacterized protein YdeI (YjbR/CyaY-like superfamily)